MLSAQRIRKARSTEHSLVPDSLGALKALLSQMVGQPFSVVVPCVLQAVALLTRARLIAIVFEEKSGLKPRTFPEIWDAEDEDKICKILRTLVVNADSVHPSHFAVDLCLDNGAECIKGVLCAPIRTRDNVIGNFYICKYHLESYNGQDEILITFVASYLALVAQNESLDESATRRAIALHGLHRISSAVATHRNSQQILRVIADTALNVLRADFVVLYEYVERDSDVRVPPVYSGDVYEPQVLEERGAIVAHRDSVVFRLLQRRNPIYAADALAEWSRFGLPRGGDSKSSFLVREAVVSSAGVPLLLDEEALGIIFVNYRHYRAFDPDEREQIELFASQAALTICLARLLEDSSHRAEGLARLTMAGTALSSAENLTIDEILSLIHAQASNLFDSNNLYVIFYNQESNSYTFPFRAGAQEGLETLGNSELNKSLAAHVIRTQSPLLADEATYEKLIEEGKIYRLGTPSKIWLGAPMVARGKVLGMIAVQDYQNSKAYDKGALNLLATLANQAAIAIVNARLLQELKTDLVEQTGFQAVSEDILKSFQNLHHVLLAVLERAVNVLISDGGVIFLRDRNQQNIRVAVNYGWPDLQNKLLLIGQGFAGKIADSRRPAYNNDYANWPDKAPIFNKHKHLDKIGSIIGIPIIVHGETLGVMILTSSRQRKRIYTQSDIERLEQFAGPVSVAIDTSRSISFQKTLIDNSPYPVIGVNTVGNLTIFNAAAEKLTGFNREDILGHNAQEIYWNGVLEIVKIHRKLEREKGTVQLESAIRSQNNEKIPVLISAAFLTDEQGSLGSITMFEDLRLLSLKGKSAKFAQLFAAIDRIDSCPLEYRELSDVITREALALFDANAGCLFLSSGSLFRARSNRYTPQRSLGSLILKAKHSLIKEALNGIEFKVLSDSGEKEGLLLPEGRGSGLLLPLRADGQVYGALILENTRAKADPFLFETEFLRVFVARSATALKRVRLAQDRRFIEETLIHSGSAITAAQMSRMVVHEIKNSLSNFFWTVREIREQSVSKRVEKHLDVLDGEVRRLRELTDRLREFASGKLVPKKKKTLLNDIVVRTVDILGSSLRRKEITSELDLDSRLGHQRIKNDRSLVFVDSNQIAQVVINLTLNAIEASDPGGKIVFQSRLRDDKAVLRVIDTGRGLTWAQARKLFEGEFSTKPSGGGLGLIISKIIIEENHSGRISIKSKVGKGTVVSIVLPIVK